MQPLISIIIPTRGRQQYCIAAIDDILSYSNHELELCIQDNSDDNQIAEHIAIKHANDSRLKYRYVKEPLNFVVNISHSFELATGRYVMMLGDDDSILPGLFDVVKWMDENNVDSICPTNIIDYYWPGAHPEHPDGWLMMSPQQAYGAKQVDVPRQVENLFKHGIIRYLEYHLPRVYHGVVKRELMEQIKMRTGNYSGGLSPDIYISIALTDVVNNHYTIESSVTIAGACRQSATSQNVNKGHRGELSEAPHFNLRGDYTWDNLVPAYYSIDTIWAETALHAVQDMNIPKLREKFNFNYMAAYAMMYNRSILPIAWKYTFSLHNEAVKSPWLSMMTVGAYSVGIFCMYLGRRIKRLLSKSVRPIVFEPVENISQASFYSKQLLGPWRSSQ